MLARMRAPTVAVSRRRLTAATGVQIGVRLLGAALGVLVAASLARSLSRPAFGELSLALTILAMAGSLGDLGTSQIAVREMASHPAERATIAGALFITQLTMSFLLGAIGLVVAFALMNGTEARIMAAFVMATMPVGAVGALTIAAQARLRPELVVIPTLVQNVIWLAIVLVLGANDARLALYGAGLFGAAVIQSAVVLVVVARVTDVTLHRTRRIIGDLLRLAWPIGLAGVFVTAYYRIDGVILFHYRGATAAAYYSAAYRVLDVLQILPMTVSGVLLPLLASAQREGQGRQRVQQLFEMAVAFLLAAALPVVVCGVILAPGIVGLIYGSHYHRSVYLLQVLLPAFIPICMGYLLTSQLILHDLLRPYIVIAFVGALINVVANVLAIPRYGAAAAAWTTVATELVSVTGVAAVVTRRLGLRLPFGRALRCLVATALTGAPVWLVRSAPLPVGIVVAAIVYPPCLLGLGGVKPAELRSLLTRQAAADA
jgi:O-antigen/teichoic acid export membrane protein